MNEPPSPPLPASPQPPGDGADESSLLRQQIAERDDMLALAAHELRNPLHALALHLALARTTALGANANGADVAERIRRAELTLKRYSERVTVLMELLSSPSAVYPLAPREADVVALLEALAESLDQEARTRRIDVRVAASLHGAERLWRIDPVAVEQIVDNLLLNAFKHSAATAVHIRLASEPGFLRIQVDDNGRGIAPEDQQSIFGKFAVASHSERGVGSGLGLWIVTRLVQAMDGDIRLQSTPGQGCNFTVRIPERDDMSNSR